MVVGWSYQGSKWCLLYHVIQYFVFSAFSSCDASSYSSGGGDLWV